MVPSLAFQAVKFTVYEGMCCHGSVDNWLLLMHNDDVCSLMNPFSKTSLELPKLARVWKRESPYSRFNPIFYKLVVPLALDSSPCSLAAALIRDDGNNYTLCISKPLVATYSFRDDKRPSPLLQDVAFFNGKLYGSTGSGKLLIFELDKGLGISSMECIINSLGDLGRKPQSLASKEAYMVNDYLVECGGRLLMVKRWFHFNIRSISDDCFNHQPTVALVVFEADLVSKPSRWRRASDLGGHALFIGQHSSKSLPATEYSGYHEDCIYFMSNYPWPASPANPLLGSGVYNIRNDTITPLISRTAAAPLQRIGQWRPTWFFPPESV